MAGALQIQSRLVNTNSLDYFTSSSKFTVITHLLHVRNITQLTLRIAGVLFFSLFFCVCVPGSMPAILLEKQTKQRTQCKLTWVEKLAHNAWTLPCSSVNMPENVLPKSKTKKIQYSQPEKLEHDPSEWNFLRKYRYRAQWPPYLLHGIEENQLTQY